MSRGVAREYAEVVGLGTGMYESRTYLSCPEFLQASIPILPRVGYGRLHTRVESDRDLGMGKYPDKCPTDLKGKK